MVPPLLVLSVLEEELLEEEELLVGFFGGFGGLGAAELIEKWVSI